MSTETTDEAKLIEAITANSREYFPNGTATIEHSDAGNRWVLLVTDELFTHRYTSKSLAGLLTKAENLFEYEDEQDEWEMRQARR